MPAETPAREEQAITLLRYLVKQWQCVDGTSACDLLDDTCDAARNAGIVTPDDILVWDAEREAETDD